jgi:L-2,4-diaminobutyrate transaminase
MNESVRNYPLDAIDRETILHPATSIVEHLQRGPHIMADARGVRIRDYQGRDLIDCGAGLWCVNIGYGRKEMAEAARDAVENLAYYHLFGGASNEPIIRLGEKVLALFHEKAGARHLSKVFFGTSGSDANDTNFKLARYYNNLRGKPHKKKFISRIGAYHGLTFAAGSLTGIPAYHKAFDMPIAGVFHTSCPHYFRYAAPGESEEAFATRMVDEIEALIAREGAETIAAFIAEPIMGTGGVLLPPKGYFEALQAVLEKNDILFIADEVITGFGRTGHWFATGGMQLKPDLVTLAKGITSAYFPVSATLLGDKVWEVLKEVSPEIGPLMHGFTYSGHPVGGALGLANIAIIEREGLVEQAAQVGPYLQRLLAEHLADSPYVGEVRGMGQMLAVEFVADRATRRLFKPQSGAHRVVSVKALEHGVLTRPLPFIEVNSFSPPLCMTRAEAEEVAERYGRAVAAAAPELARLAAA